MSEEFQNNVEHGGYPPALMKLTAVDKTKITEALDILCKIWTTVEYAVTSAITRSLIAGQLIDREDIVRIYLDELLDKTVTVNLGLITAIFGSATERIEAKQAFAAKYTDLVTTTRRYQQGLPEGYCRVTLALTADAFVLGMKDLEIAYGQFTNIFNETTALSKTEIREIYADFTTRSIGSWTDLIKKGKVHIDASIDPNIVRRCRHEAKHFEWMRRESMPEKEAIKVAMDAGVKFAGEYSFTSWFRDEDN